MKPPFSTRTDISRWPAAINKTFAVDCASLQPRKSSLTNKHDICIHSLCTSIFFLWEITFFFTIYIYIYILIYLSFVSVWIGEYMDVWMDVCMDACMDVCMDVFTGGCMDVWMDV